MLIENFSNFVTLDLVRTNQTTPQELVDENGLRDSIPVVL